MFIQLSEFVESLITSVYIVIIDDLVKSSRLSVIIGSDVINYKTVKKLYKTCL